ncbi:hypothetical protein X975_18778, partial [Stegodyphus mimosarum]
MLFNENHDCYKIDVMAFQEMRWIEQGIQDSRNHAVFYSCDSKKHVLVQASLLIRHIIIDFEAKPLRLCKIRLRGKFFNYSIMSTHAPTEDKEEDKDTFYEKI